MCQVLCRHLLSRILRGRAGRTAGRTASIPLAGLGTGVRYLLGVQHNPPHDIGLVSLRVLPALRGRLRRERLDRS
jgi:hypothetical protein